MTDTESAFVAEPIVAPAAARDFVKKAASAAKERAATFQANADKATTTVEQKFVSTVGEVASLTRQAHQAAYEDAQAFFSGVDQLASAKSVGKAVQIYVDYLRSRNEIAVARARAASDYLGKLIADGAKTVQEIVEKVGPFNKAA